MAAASTREFFFAVAKLYRQHANQVSDCEVRRLNHQIARSPLRRAGKMGTYDEFIARTVRRDIAKSH
jgi:hypothetical protein